jgi:hypothetical protein
MSLSGLLFPFLLYSLSSSLFILNFFAHFLLLIHVYPIFLHFYHGSEFFPLSVFVIHVKLISQSNSDIAPLFFFFTAICDAISTVVINPRTVLFTQSLRRYVKLTLYRCLDVSSVLLNTRKHPNKSFTRTCYVISRRILYLHLLPAKYT